MTTVADLTRDYRAALLRYLPRQEEVVLSTGYLIGRAAVSAGVSMLVVVDVHHQVLQEICENSTPEQIPAVLGSAAGFLIEVLAPYDMTQRGLLSGP